MLNLFKSTNKHIFLVWIVCCQISCVSKLQTEQTDCLQTNVEKTIPEEVKRLLMAYPDQIISFDNNHLVFCNGSRLLFDDAKQKSEEELIENPDIQDMFAYSYTKGKVEKAPAKYHNPGRIRNEEFFKKMYGKNSMEVTKNLTTIVWCPKLVGQKIQITKINGVAQQLAAVSAELDEHPEWKDYLYPVSTFNWRTIRGANNRLSPHSFGIAIDLNTKYSNYWQWDCKCTTENVDLTYKNKLPQGIIDIFEKHGFIWGGKWYHYDTMHFEYRPELLFSEIDEKE